MRVVSVPRITVLTTVYNGARYLAEAIDSVLADGFDDFEYVIVDDGSTDATPRILADAAARDPRIVLLRHEANRGIGAATNRGLAIARGQYVARLDADDISMPGRFARQVAYLDAHADVALVSMNYESIDADGAVLHRSHRDHPPAVVEYLLNFSNSLGGHSQVMFRRSAVTAAGGYDESCGASLDYDLWTRIVRHGRMFVLPEIGMRYRVHDQSLSVRAREEQIDVGTRVVRQTLSTYLGRTLTDDEVRVLTHAWRPVLPAIDPKLAKAILREAYRIFCEREPDRRLQRIVRTVKARRLMNTAMLLLAKGDVGNAMRHAVHALGWDVGAALGRMVKIVAGVTERRRNRRRSGDAD